MDKVVEVITYCHLDNNIVLLLLCYKLQSIKFKLLYGVPKNKFHYTNFSLLKQAYKMWFDLYWSVRNHYESIVLLMCLWPVSSHRDFTRVDWGKIILYTALLIRSCWNWTNTHKIRINQSITLLQYTCMLNRDHPSKCNYYFCIFFTFINCTAYIFLWLSSLPKSLLKFAEMDS